ncbi:hypothetical protein EB796_019772 [Bugula neritina]|uniref:Uncharacterized protein n=1 Tax=Bugula neritina TaxID=10212 RepID=A0A7J7J7B7_BUGNE|nr:hypothetical protein EB796_019772 [Bugula neritina]
MEMSYELSGHQNHPHVPLPPRYAMPTHMYHAHPYVPCPPTCTTTTICPLPPTHMYHAHPYVPLSPTDTYFVSCILGDLQGVESIGMCH